MKHKINFSRFSDWDADEIKFSSYLDYVVDPEKSYPEIDFLLQYRGKGLLPRGNLVAFSGRQKSGKSFAVSLLAASMLSGNLSDQFTSRHKGLKVLYADLEMHVSDVSARSKTTARLAGLDENRTNPNFIVLSLREVDYDKRLDKIIEAIDATKSDLVVLDGLADIMLDFNSVEESTKVVNRLMRLSSEKDTVIICIIHLNKASAELKGHAGSILGQKASEVFSVEFNKKALTYTVEQSVSRHALIDNFSFRIVEGTPELIEPETPEQKSGLADLEAETAFYKIFEGRTELSYTVLTQEYSELRGLSMASAKKHVADQRKKGYLIKNKVGGYTFSNPDRAFQ